MADTSNVDLADLVELRTGIRLGKAWGTGEKRTRKGPCPFCKVGTNRFAVFVNTVPQHYHCGINSNNGCGAHGDAITLLREYEGLTYHDACEELNIDPGSEYVRPRGTPYNRDEGPPCKQWQERAATIIHLAQRALWSSRGASALAYLHSRGFTDETIRTAHLGYIPLGPDGRWYKDECKLWGLQLSEEKRGVWLPEGILLPFYEGDTLWRLTVRRLGLLQADEPKYLDVLGSGQGLYNVDALCEGVPAILCEGPLDALSGIQQCREKAAFVATGSVSRGRTLQWLTRLCLASHVLIAFDDDENRTGDKAAKDWLVDLPHATQWLPWAHDLNDMLTEGLDIQAWVDLGIASAALTQRAEDTVQMPVPIADEDEALLCATCGCDAHTSDSFYFSAEGVPFCSVACEMQAAPSRLDPLSSTKLCSSHTTRSQ